MTRTWIVAAAALLMHGTAVQAREQPVLDCPLRDAAYSLDSPLIDVLLNPAARAVVDQAAGKAFNTMPPGFMNTEPPSFAAILTLGKAAAFVGVAPAAIAQMAPKLAAIPVTDADRAARCARYDDDPVDVVLPPGKPRLLLFEKINGFKDVPGFNAAHAAFLDLARHNGWTLVVTDKAGAFHAETLRQFDLVIWNNLSGDVLTVAQRQAFREYIEHGGSYLGVHGSAGDPVYFWDWYVDTLIGARFAGHPMVPQFQPARIRVEDARQPLARDLPAQWTMKDEWYSFSTNPRAAGAHVLATLDETTYVQKGWGGEQLTMGDHPIAWSNCIGKGRMVYSAIGHLPETYANPEYRTILRNAVVWLTVPAPCKPQ